MDFRKSTDFKDLEDLKDFVDLMDLSKDFMDLSIRI